VDFPKVAAFLDGIGQPSYRARQVYEGATRGFAQSYDELTPLPVDLRRRLGAAIPLRELTTDQVQHSTDGTIKVRLTTTDGYPVEAVAMRHRDRSTVCVSSQSGCPLKCTFCATGSMGLGRNLTSGEIVEQVLVLAAMLREQERRVTNVVMMGMGEPFLNYDEVLAACHMLNDPAGFGLGARQMAISTAGWIPGIERLASEPMQIRLALSLHAPNDELRAELMPVNRRFPLRKLMAACRAYREATGRRIFVEYLLLDGVNDTDAHATELAALLAGGGYHVNLISYNPTQAGYTGSGQGRVSGFAATLGKLGVSATYRSSHGRDIDAACGQLAVGDVRGLRRRNRAAAAASRG
jgi:23S rRNA (adenine2503-C2)-methyltransferase